MLLLAGECLAIGNEGPGSTDNPSPTGQPALFGMGLADLQVQWPLLEKVYALRQGKPIWYEQGHLNGRVAQLVALNARVSAEGLLSEDYLLPLMDSSQVFQAGDIWTIEYLLTDAFLQLARDLRIGQFKSDEIDPLWNLPGDEFDPTEALNQLLVESSPAGLIKALSPQAEAYQRLRQALRDYRRLESQGGWPELPDSNTLRPGERRPEVAILRQRLQIEGDHPEVEPLDGQLYGELLQASVRRFQRRNGLADDGVVGPLTHAMLNIGVVDRIKQIRANMERWRWLPRELGSQYLLVNTAGFDLTLVMDGEAVLRQRTINGTQKRQTPSFKSQISHLVVNPEWTVPRTIAVEDLLPKQQQDVEFLDRLGIQVFQREAGQWSRLDPLAIEWSRYNEDNFPFLLRQTPGERNSLGRIKFQMDNPYAIYLHDTPAKGLFKKPIRAFSSGCVRVQGVDQLARKLLLNGGQSPVVVLDQHLQGVDTHIQKLSRPIPVYLVYLTAWVDEQGRVHFRPDIYQRNNELLLAIREETAKITVSHPQAAANSL